MGVSGRDLAREALDGLSRRRRCIATGLAGPTRPMILSVVLSLILGAIGIVLWSEGGPQPRTWGAWVLLVAIVVVAALPLLAVLLDGVSASRRRPWPPSRAERADHVDVSVRLGPHAGLPAHGRPSSS